MLGDVRLYYVSDHSYNRLTTMAQQYGYVEFGSERVKGLSQFLNDLAQIPMEDNRPRHIMERHNQEIALNHAPSWTNVRQRRARSLKLTEDAVARYVLVAFQVGIIRSEPWPKGGPARNTPYPTVGYVLEAIGLGWITPIEFPSKVRSYVAPVI